MVLVCMCVHVAVANAVDCPPVLVVGGLHSAPSPPPSDGFSSTLLAGGLLEERRGLVWPGMTGCPPCYRWPECEHRVMHSWPQPVCLCPQRAEGGEGVMHAQMAGSLTMRSSSGRSSSSWFLTNLSRCCSPISVTRSWCEFSSSLI